MFRLTSVAIRRLPQITCTYSSANSAKSSKFHFSTGLLANRTGSIHAKTKSIRLNQISAVNAINLVPSRGVHAGESGANVASSTNAATTSSAAPVVWTDIASQQEPEAITGAIIPFAQQHFMQWLCLPYTYAVMYYMDFLLGHMPWWLAIAGTTLTCKIITFPLAIKLQNIMIKTNNIAPESQKIQVKINDAYVSGDAYSVALERTKLKLLNDEHGLSTSQRLWPILVQAPMFMSIFFLLRSLTSQPVESLKTGGAFWFENLTVADPYMILPIITCLTMLLQFEHSLRTAGTPAMGPTGRWILRSGSLLLFAFVHNFPAAMLVFWTTNNILTLTTNVILKTPAISKKVGLPQIIKHDPASLPLSNRSFMSQLKNAKEVGQKSKTSMDIRRLDDIAFKKAGVGPLRKTYSSPPPQSRQ